jgi:hypothetical protein
VSKPQIVSHDVDVTFKNIEKTVTPCYTQIFSGIKDSNIVVYTDINSSSCSALKQDAMDACTASKSSEECSKLVKDAYVPPTLGKFETIIDTGFLPSFDASNKFHYSKHDHHSYCYYDTHQRRYIEPYFDKTLKKLMCPDASEGEAQWWRWKRVNEYPCKNGWTCDDNELSDYRGGAQCNIDKDCNVIAEHGVCDMQSNTCKTGSLVGKECTTHEHCDRTSFIEGKCAQTGVCSIGKTNIQASYYKPKACTPPEQGEANLSYCGEIDMNGKKVFTGYCEAYQIPGKSEDSYGCKAFLYQEEVDEKRDSEESFQNGYKNGNFDENHLFDWQRLASCPQSYIKTIDGVSVCTATSEKVNLAPYVLEAEDSSNARSKYIDKLCKDHFGPCPYESQMTRTL